MNLDMLVHLSDCDMDDPEHCYQCQSDYADDAYIGYDDYDSDNISFMDPGGRSALRAENILTAYLPDGDMILYCPQHACHTQADHTDGYCRGCGFKLNIRNRPCPNCACENMISDEDVRARYQCDHCADAAEGYGSYRSCSGGY